MAAAQARVLVAVAPQARERLAAVLRGFEVTWADSLDKATHIATAERFDLVVVGSHFDESTALQALERLTAGTSGAPLVCVRGLPFAGLGHATVKAFRDACEALGAACVIDLLDYPDDERGNARIRALLDAALRHTA